MSITVQDYRSYTVSASGGAAGVMKITSADHPTSVSVNKEYSWYVVGQATGGAVHNPGVGLWYYSGPADKITLVLKDGSKMDVPKGWAGVVYKKGDYAEGTIVDSRDGLRGAIIPVAGTYEIRLIAGVLTDDEALLGMPFGNVFTLVEPGSAIKGYSIPFTITAGELADLAVSLLGAAIPIAVPLAAIGINEMRRR
jgi:hypothetical protein